VYVYIVLSLFHGHPNEAEGPLVVRGPHFANLCITRACTVNRVVHASSVVTVCQSREVYQWCTWYVRLHTYIHTHTHTHARTHTHIYTYIHTHITLHTYTHTHILRTQTHSHAQRIVFYLAHNMTVLFQTVDSHLAECDWRINELLSHTVVFARGDLSQQVDTISKEKWGKFVYGVIVVNLDNHYSYMFYNKTDPFSSEEGKSL
jgi:hypothetical protein